ncbi:MAG: SMC-Scp complex subunit ScpB [Caldilineaceae bacterium]
MKSFNAFRLIIDLFSMMWNALRGRPRAAQIAQKESAAAVDETTSPEPLPAVHEHEPKRVVTASEPPSQRETVLTATIYIDAAETAAADDMTEQIFMAETETAETDTPVLENDAADTVDAAIGEIAIDEETAMAGDQPQQPLPPADKDDARLQAAEQNGHMAEIYDAVAITEATAAERIAEAEIDPAEKMPAEQWVDLNGESVALTAVLESLLFVSDTALEPARAAKVLPCTVEQIEAGLQRLRMIYQHEGRGLRVQERGGRYLLVTMPTAAPVIEAFLNLDLDTRLSGPALEALAVIAYRQPVTRSQIEAVRGVDCGHVLRVLLQHELIEEAGRLETPGRPILYGVTDRFLQHFGLTSMSELPKLETNEADMLWAATQLAEETGAGDAVNSQE